MLYSNSQRERVVRSAHEQFYNLLRQERFDKALRVREKKENHIGKEVFMLSVVREAGRKAIILAAKIGKAEDPKLFQKRFRLPRSIWEDLVVLRALKEKLESWKNMRHPEVERLLRLYPFLKQ